MDNTALDRETNTRYYAGPAVKDVAKVTGRDYKPVEVPEKRALPERQYTHNERTVKNESPVVRYDRSERQTQPAPKQNTNTIRNERPEQPVKKQYSAPVRNEYQPKSVERKSTSPVRTTEKPQVKQTTPAKKSPAERASR
jgi:glucan-binding YG repeat protein